MSDIIYLNKSDKNHEMMIKNMRDVAWTFMSSILSCSDLCIKVKKEEIERLSGFTISMSEDEEHVYVSPHVKDKSSPYRKFTIDEILNFEEIDNTRHKQGWIHVDKRLPSFGIPVLVTGTSGIQHVAIRQKTTYSYRFIIVLIGHGDTKCEMEVLNVTHWMILPSLP
jgi:hypothetical protein